MTATCIVAAMLLTCASAQASTVDTRYKNEFRKEVTHLRKEVDKKKGRSAGGRDILKYGIERPGKDRPARTAEVKDYEAVLHRIKNPPPRPQVVITRATTPQGPPTTQASTQQVASPQSSGGSGPGSSTSQCESGGNPRAVSPGGTYRGKWQFDQQTWNAYAPPGYRGTDPINAPESIQDVAAGNVPYDAWPNC